MLFTLFTAPTPCRFLCCSRWRSSQVVSSMATHSSGSGNGGAANERIAEFKLSPSSILKIQKGDITKWSIPGQTCAIVNAANERMLGGGGVDGAIHRAAGPGLLAACEKVPQVQPGIRCPTGESRITGAFSLPVAYVIHTVGPIYDGSACCTEYLRNAYKNSLLLAKENNIQCVAFPAVSCGVYGYPFREAATIAISTIKECSNLQKLPSQVHFVLFLDDIYNIWLEKAEEVFGYQS